MKPSKQLVTKIPLKTIWDQNVDRKAIRIQYLSADELKAKLKDHPVVFIVANIGDPLIYIPTEKCYEYWKSEIKANLVNHPDEPFCLERYPGGYAYLASEWSGDMETPIVLLEKYH